MAHLIKVMFFIWLLSPSVRGALSYSKCDQIFNDAEVRQIRQSEFDEVIVEFQMLDSAYSAGTPQFLDWARYTDETPFKGTAIYRGIKLSIRNLENDGAIGIKTLSEPFILSRLNSFGIGPNLVGTFKQYGETWMATELIEGDYKKFQMDKIPFPDVQFIKEWVYGPSPFVNALIGRVNNRTLLQVKKVFETFNQMGLEAHDFQFLIAPNGSIIVINTRLFQYSENPWVVNERILQTVLKQLNKLASGEEIEDLSTSAL